MRMGITYENVVPWGRSFDEYVRMFHLTENDLDKKIVGCGDGPASFNAEMTRRGHQVISCDPLYEYNTDQIRDRIDATFPDVMEQSQKNQDRFVWDIITSPEELGQIRLKAMNRFLEDYDQGRKDGRYMAASLPKLPFPSGSFDLALCSHFLFLYSDNLSLGFHEKAITEMCRVANESRIFPLVTYNSQPSPYVSPLLRNLETVGLEALIEKVPYEFQRNGNMMLRVFSHD